MEWFIYLLKVSASTALFWAFYMLCLKRLTFFKLNRFYLLFTLLLSFAIPAFNITIHKEIKPALIAETPKATQKQAVSNASISSSKEALATSNAAAKSNTNINWKALAIYVYCAVVLGFLLSGLSALKQMLQFIKKSAQHVNKVNGIKLISKSTGFTNCSFFNYVFVDETAFDDTGLQLFLRHEKAHIKQYHSLDNILLLIAKAILWFNPIVYLYGKELEQTHEFEADEITSQNFGTQYYANLLLNMAVNQNQTPLTHHFAKSAVKSRIKMLFNPKSKNMKKAIYLLPLPICVGLVFLFSVQFIYAQLTPTAKIEPVAQAALSVEPTITKAEIAKADTIHPTKEKTALTEAQKDSVVRLSEAAMVESIVAEKEVRNSNNYRIVDVTSISEDRGCKVLKIECDDKHTIVSFEYIATNPNDWAMLNKEIYLQASNDMKHFQFVKAEGIPMKPYKHSFNKAGDKLNFKVYFEKVPLTAERIDIIERAGASNYFNFYEVPLPPSYFAKK